MTLADSNFWLTLNKHLHHPAAQAWTQERESGELLFCRSTQQSFLRLLTTQSVLAQYGIPPLTNKAAWSVYEGFRADRRVSWAEEPRGLEDRWKKFAGGSTASSKQWMDAYLAAFALIGRHSFVIADRAFSQYKGLDVVVLTSKA